MMLAQALNTPAASLASRFEQVKRLLEVAARLRRVVAQPHLPSQ